MDLTTISNGLLFLETLEKNSRSRLKDFQHIAISEMQTLEKQLEKTNPGPHKYARFKEFIRLHLYEALSKTNPLSTKSPFNSLLGLASQVQLVEATETAIAHYTLFSMRYPLDCYSDNREQINMALSNGINVLKTLKVNKKNRDENLGDFLEQRLCQRYKQAQNEDSSLKSPEDLCFKQPFALYAWGSDKIPYSIKQKIIEEQFTRS